MYAIVYLTDFLKVCGHLNKKASNKGSKITITKGKEKKKDRGEGKEEEKKNAEVVALLVFVIAALYAKMPIWR